jgi:IS30 family transposase
MKKLKPVAGDSGKITTAAGLARRLGKHRGTVTRALRKVRGGTASRVGHQFMLSSRLQAAARKVLGK